MDTERTPDTGDTGVVADPGGCEPSGSERVRGRPVLPYRSPRLVVHGSLARLTGGGTEMEPEDFFSGSIRTT